MPRKKCETWPIDVIWLKRRMKEEHMTEKELGDLLGCNERTIRRYFTAGQIRVKHAKKTSRYI